jgi:hypothetical protein
MQVALQTKVSQVGAVFATGHLQIREVGLYCMRSWKHSGKSTKETV